MQSVSEQGIKFKVIQNWVKLGPDTPKEDISQKPTLHSPTLPPPKIIRVVNLIVAYQIAIRSLNHKNGKWPYLSLE